MSYSLDSKLIDTDDNAPKTVEYDVDPRLLVPMKGHSYTCRLISISNAKSGRKSPFILKWNHTSTNLNMTTGKYETEFVTCPTTAYTNVENPFEACPCCTAAGQLWKQFDETKQEKYRKMFDRAKRRFAAFIVVLVISNTENAEFNGKIMIMVLNNRNVYKDFCAFLDNGGKKLFFNNFDNPEAKNVVITVGSEKTESGDYRRFTFEEVVSGKKLCSEVTPEWTAKFLKDSIVPLRFDEDFMLPFDIDAMNIFYERRIRPLLSAPGVKKSRRIPDASDSFPDLSASADKPATASVTESNPEASKAAAKTRNKRVTEATKSEIVAAATEKPDASKAAEQTTSPAASNAAMSDAELEDFLKTI